MGVTLKKEKKRKPVVEILRLSLEMTMFACLLSRTVKTRSLTMDDLERRPGSPEIMVVAGSVSSDEGKLFFVESLLEVVGLP